MADSIPFYNNQWYPIHDTVMGGRSSGATTQNTETQSMLFSGMLSLENNGGFASVRLPVEEDQLRMAQGIRITLKGDGRKYLATIRRDYEQRMIYHRASFQTTKGEEQEIIIPFADYKPYAYGRSLPQVTPLHHKHNHVRELGFMLADKQSGSFSLEILSMETYGETSMVPTITDSQRESNDPSSAVPRM